MNQNMTDIAEEEIEGVRIRVAEKLGWRKMEYSQSSLLVGHPPGRNDIHAVPSYARDVKAAWEIIDFLTARKIRVSLVNEGLSGHIRDFSVRIGPKDRPLGAAVSRTAPLAVCLAFLELPVKALADPISNASHIARHTGRQLGTC